MVADTGPAGDTSLETQTADAADAEAAAGKYLYGIVPDAQAAAWMAGSAQYCVGIDGGTIRCISHGPLAAIVSDLPNEKLRPNRRRLAVHHQVLKDLMAECTVLPMAFGVIAESSDAVRKVLSLNQATLDDKLRHLEGKVEMGLKVFWDVMNVFEFFVSTHPDLAAFRDKLYRGRRQPTRDDKIELGGLFNDLLNKDRDTHTETVERVLGPRCAEIKRNKPRNEREVMNLACLILKDAQKEFEAGVFEAAALFDDNFRFDFNGPWPPYNFVTGLEVADASK